MAVSMFMVLLLVLCVAMALFLLFLLRVLRKKEEDGDVASVGCRRSGSASSSNEGSTQKLEV